MFEHQNEYEFILGIVLRCGWNRLTLMKNDMRFSLIEYGEKVGAELRMDHQ